MTSPTEPSEPGNGAERRVEQSDLPPWQRAERRRGSHAASTGPQPVPVRSAPTEIIPVIDADAPPPRQAAPPPVRSGRPSAGLDARLSRFVTGTAAPGAFATPVRPDPRDDSDTAALHEPSIRTERVERVELDEPSPSVDEHEDPQVNEDLPDLSGPVPRRPEPRREREPAVSVGPRRRGPLRASMQIRRVDPWATLKVSLVLSVVFFFVWMIAVALLYLVLGAMGVWSKLNDNVGELLTNSGGGELVSSGTIFGTALLIGLVNIVLMTAAATIGAFIYNLTADLVGGVEVTLADLD